MTSVISIPHPALGFTAGLISTISTSKSAVDSYVEKLSKELKTLDKDTMMSIDERERRIQEAKEGIVRVKR